MAVWPDPTHGKCSYGHLKISENPKLVSEKRLISAYIYDVLTVHLCMHLRNGHMGNVRMNVTQNVIFDEL